MSTISPHAGPLAEPHSPVAYKQNNSLAGTMQPHRHEGPLLKVPAANIV